MRYKITNGNQYVKVIKSGYELTNNLADATIFSHVEANRFFNIHKELKDAYKIRWLNKNVTLQCVITSGWLFATQAAPTRKQTKALEFKEIADVEVYLRKHKPFENCVVVDELWNEIEMPEIRTFTDDQLKIIGVKPNVTAKKVKRIQIPTKDRIKVYRDGGGKCALCGKHLTYEEFTVDHILPLSRGGKNNVSNYQILCDCCNKFKGNKTEDYLSARMTEIMSNQLFCNPDNDAADMMIRAIVRGKLNNMTGGTCYGAIQ